MPRRTFVTEMTDRRAYEMRQLYGLSYAAIAEQLGMRGESTARVAANRHARRLGLQPLTQPMTETQRQRRQAAGARVARQRWNQPTSTTVTTSPLTTEVASTMLSMQDRTFGIELEFTGRYKHDTANAIAQALGVPHIHSMGYHSLSCETCGRHIPESERYSQWRVERDGSVTQFRGGGEWGGEVVSPVLKLADLPIVEKVLRAMRTPTESMGHGFAATTNRRCGLHIHVFTKDLTKTQRANIVRRWAALDQSVMQTLVAVSRRGNYYCMPMSSQEVDRVAFFLENGNSAALETVTQKYRSLNVLPFKKIGTFEFRLHQGTLNFSKVKNWVTLLLAFVQSMGDEQEATVEGGAVERTERLLDLLVEKTPVTQKLKTFWLNRQQQVSPQLRRQAASTTPIPLEVI
ncbi:MAG: hypothetical protein EBT75_01295 [Proteobacteria bacterium]|nr:hypothetical protein [Pseudomonadota bacterium]NBS49303.1 hypothetical protein [Verrucomicrobiota bacterium]